MKVDLTGARSYVRSKTISSYISRSGAQLTQVIIRKVPSDHSSRVLEFLGRCRRLEHLDLCMWAEAKDIYGMLKDSKQLKSVSVSRNTLFGFQYLPQILRQLPLLEQLTLSDFNWKDAPAVNWPLPLPNLKSLTLNSAERPHRQHTPVHALHIPGLVSVCLSCPW